MVFASSYPLVTLVDNEMNSKISQRTVVLANLFAGIIVGEELDK